MSPEASQFPNGGGTRPTNPQQNSTFVQYRWGRSSRPTSRGKRDRDARVMHRQVLAFIVGLLAGLALLSVTNRATGAPSAQEFRAQLAKERDRTALVTKRYQRLRQQRLQQPSVQEAISLAAFIYRVPRHQLERIAFCESRHNPSAVNRSSQASGLFQFLPSTWQNNWYGQHGFSVWSPYANALGAAQHMSKYGYGAWECA